MHLIHSSIPTYRILFGENILLALDAEFGLKGYSSTPYQLEKQDGVAATQLATPIEVFFGDAFQFRVLIGRNMGVVNPSPPKSVPTERHRKCLGV